MLPFRINIGPSAFSYVLGRVLAQCTEFTLNYLDNIMISPRHGKNILGTSKKSSGDYKMCKYKFFKTKVHYLGFLVGTNGVQPLPEKVTAIEAVELPKDIDELRQFLGLVGFYRKFIPFFMDVTAYLNTILRKE